MSRLKELTWEHHKNAERQKFVKVLMGGKISPEVYATFLYNQHPQYNILEVHAMAQGLFDGLGDIRRGPAIFADYEELWKDKDNPPKLLNVTKSFLTSRHNYYLRRTIPLRENFNFERNCKNILCLHSYHFTNKNLSFLCNQMNYNLQL